MDPDAVGRGQRAVRVAVALAVLGLAAASCGDEHARDLAADHGPAIPSSATAAAGCAGTPYETGKGNYDSGPEDVKGEARAAFDDWLHEEGYALPDVSYAESARHDGTALFTWSEAGTVLAAFVVTDGTDGLDDHRGWGVTSYAVCDPAEWPPARSDETGVQVWSTADGDRVPTTMVQSYAGPFNCGYDDMTFLQVGPEATYYGNPPHDFDSFLRTTYSAHTPVPDDAKDTGYQRDGRQLWVTDQAAYVGTPDDAERWPAPNQRIGCD